MFGFRSFLFERRQANVFVELGGLIIVLFRVGLAQFFCRSWAVEVSCWAFAVFFVGAVVTRYNFVGLVRLNVFGFALGLRNFCVGVAL